jgi:WD40 repeat protein
MVIALTAGNGPAAGATAAAADGDGFKQQQYQQQQPRKQRFFIGHSAFVSCMALGGQGSLLATGQEGKQPLIRLWDCRKAQQGQQGSGKCLTMLCGEFGPLMCRLAR